MQKSKDGTIIVGDEQYGVIDEYQQWVGETKSFNDVTVFYLDHGSSMDPKNTVNNGQLVLTNFGTTDLTVNVIGILNGNSEHITADTEASYGEWLAVISTSTGGYYDDRLLFIHTIDL